MTSGPKPICAECIHADPNLATCTAFPEGIPAEIFMSETDHRIPVDGDGGIQFTPRKGSALTGNPEQLIPWLVLQPDKPAQEEGGD